MTPGARYRRAVFILLAVLLAWALPIAAQADDVDADAHDSAEEYKPLGAVLMLNATELVDPGEYAVSVAMVNQGDDVIGDVTLRDGDGNIMWGPTDLDLSESYTWSGTLNITQQMLSDGEASCTISYVLAKGDPDYEQRLTDELTASVTKVSAQPALEFSRSQSMTYAQPGQSVTLTYTVKNTGNVPLTGIEVSDTLMGQVGTLDTLAVDEKKTFTKRVTVGTTALTSLPTVSYSYEGSQDIVEKEIASSSIKIAQPSLEVALEADATLVNPGDTIMLRCKLINNGNVGYKKIQLSDQVLGDLGFIDDLRAGRDTVYAKSVRIQSKTTFKFTITAKDTTGSDVTAVSNSLTIDVVSGAGDESLSLTAQADTQSVVSGDPVTFTLLLSNNGATDISGISISERTRGLITQVDTLAAGDSMPIIAQYNVTGYEMFTFSASMTQQDGATREALADTITISLGAATPDPSSAPLPSPTPGATVSPAMRRAYDAAMSRIFTFLLAAAVCIIIVLLVALSINRANDGKHRRKASRRTAPRVEQQQSMGDTAVRVRPVRRERAAGYGDDDIKVYVPVRSLRSGQDEDHHGAPSGQRRR